MSIYVLNLSVSTNCNHVCFRQHVRSFERKKFKVMSVCVRGGLMLNICIKFFARYNRKISRTSILTLVFVTFPNLDYLSCEVIYCKLIWLVSSSMNRYESFEWWNTKIESGNWRRNIQIKNFSCRCKSFSQERIT